MTKQKTSIEKTTVTLGGKEYAITPLPYAKAKAWRAKVSNPMGTLADTLTVEVDALPNLSQILRSVQGVILTVPDTIAELLFEYSPVLAADRAYIEEHAYDQEIVDAFLEALKQAYPFGKALSGLAVLTNGLQQSRTSKS